MRLMCSSLCSGPCGVLGPRAAQGGMGLSKPTPLSPGRGWWPGPARRPGAVLNRDASGRGGAPQVIVSVCKVESGDWFWSRTGRNEAVARHRECPHPSQAAVYSPMTSAVAALTLSISGRQGVVRLVCLSPRDARGQSDATPLHGLPN